MRRAALAASIGLIAALGRQPALGAQRSQSYDALISAASRPSERSWDIERARNSQMISFEGTADAESAPVNAGKPGPSFKRTVLENAGQGWNKGMKFVDWYDRKIIKPVAGPEDAPLPRKIGGFFYTLIHLPVVLAGFWAAAVMAGAGAVRGAFKAVQKT